MSTKKTPTKTSKPAAVEPSATASVSKLRKGSGVASAGKRIITIYGAFKTRKTSSLRNLPAGRTKWILSDPNAVPTLVALDRLPHADDVYEVRSIEELRNLLEEMNTLCETEGPEALGIDFLVIDSYTQFSEWHQQDVAKSTGQRFLGDNNQNNGWNQFNAEFGACLDLVAALRRFITVIGIVHAKPKWDAKKGAFAAFSLSPAMSEKLGRMSNWILLKTFEEVIDDDKKKYAIDHPEDKRYTVEHLESGDTLVYEDIFFTRPTSGWIAAINSLKFAHEEPGDDITALFEKDGLL